MLHRVTIFFHERSVSMVYLYPTLVDVPEKQRLPLYNRYYKWHIGITTYLCAMRKLVALLVRYFFQGIIIISPIAVTAYAAYSIFDFVDSKIPNLPRGLGFLLVIASLIVLGWMASTFFAWKFLIGFFDGILERTPFLKFIYTSVKEVVESFMGDKRKFNKPVLVRVRKDPEVMQIGFITQKDLTRMGLENKIAVYMPHSYAVSGFVYIVDADQVKPLDMNPADAMKMAVSGGIAGYGDDEDAKKTDRKRQISNDQNSSQPT